MEYILVKLPLKYHWSPSDNHTEICFQHIQIPYKFRIVLGKYLRIKGQELKIHACNTAQVAVLQHGGNKTEVKNGTAKCVLSRKKGL